MLPLVCQIMILNHFAQLTFIQYQPFVPSYEHNTHLLHSTYKIPLPDIQEPLTQQMASPQCHHHTTTGPLTRCSNDAVLTHRLRSAHAGPTQVQPWQHGHDKRSSPYGTHTVINPIKFIRHSQAYAFDKWQTRQRRVAKAR